MYPFHTKFWVEKESMSVDWLCSSHMRTHSHPVLLSCSPSLAQPPSCSSRNAAVYAAIDELAALSSQAANIRQPLTTCEKLVQSDHVLYLSWQYNE